MNDKNAIRNQSTTILLDFSLPDNNPQIIIPTFCFFYFNFENEIILNEERKCSKIHGIIFEYKFYNIHIK